MLFKINKLYIYTYKHTHTQCQNMPAMKKNNFNILHDLKNLYIKSVYKIILQVWYAIKKKCRHNAFIHIHTQ